MRIVFMGTPDFSVSALKNLIQNETVVAVYTQPDKPVGRGLQVQPSPVKKVALEHSIPVFTPEKISTDEEVERLKSFQADFFVVVAYGQILKPAVIAVPNLGCINIHSSLLPRWRGAAPIHWALLSGDAETGVTTMMIAPKLDAGDMLLQEKIKIQAEDTSSTLLIKLADLGGNLILTTLRGIVSGTVKRVQQDESKVTYAKKLTKEMEELDWSGSATSVDLQVRALNPWPGTRIESTIGMKIKIKSGKPSLELRTAKAGQLISHPNGLFLTCAQGCYWISELQEEGKKPVSSADFLNGLKGRGVTLPLDLVLKASKT